MSSGLHLISSNRVENLVAALAKELSGKPLSAPFGTETIVVPSPVMARWVNLQLARYNGIAANIHYPLPATWIWETAGSLLPDLPDLDPLRPEAAAWRIFFLLPDLIGRAEFDPVHRYLHEDSDAIRRWQLSLKIAELFDRYQFYRPDLIRGWSTGTGGHWQAVLWRELLRSVPSRHRVAVIDEVLDLLARSEPVPRLPERISLFAISSLPPVFVDVIHALATQTRILLLLHSPSQHYWADLSSKKTIARIRVQSPEKAAYYDNANELLASWGRQGQVLQDLLLSHETLQSETTELYREAQQDSLLHRLQNAILGLDSEPVFSGPDSSLQIHVCHSPLRECQVLHDQLLAILDADPSLRPEDVLVMIPEITRYAPYIEAVFGRAEHRSRPFIPWNLSDISIAEEHPLIEAFLRILSLPDSRFMHSEVRSFLDLPELAERFDLDPDECDILRGLLGKAKVHWGVDADHKTSFGLPPIEENTWHHAARRFFAGYAIGTAELWHGIAPIAAVEGDRAGIIGKFWLLLENLIECRTALAAARSGAEWQIHLNALLDRFFVERDDESGRIQQIRDALDELGEATSEGILSRELVLHWLQSTFRAKSTRGRYFSGGVSVCGMRPMRSLPFRVICLLGMNEQVFPRRDQRVEFDLMQQSWKAGDPSKADEDRYLLLETLICARQILYISYTGRDLRDNSARQPSVLVQELIDFVDRYTVDRKESGDQVGQVLIHVHPMQAFSPKNFAPGRSAYDRHWYRIANALRNPKAPPKSAAWPKQRLPTQRQETQRIELARLQRFLRNPVQFFFNTRLKIRLDDETEIVDSESFSPDALTRWVLKSALAAGYLRSGVLCTEQLKAEGQLPHGGLAAFWLARIQDELRPVLAGLADYRGRGPETRRIELIFPDEHRLCGKIPNCYPEIGLLHFTPSKFRGSHLLALWLEHLCLSAVDRLDGPASRLVCADQTWRIPALDAGEAEGFLWKILQRYLNALEIPPAILPEASFAWASSRLGGRSSDPRKSALSKWEGVPFLNIPGEKEDPYLEMTLRNVGLHPVDDPEFARCSQEFYADVLEYAEKM